MLPPHVFLDSSFTFTLARLCLRAYSLVLSHHPSNTRLAIEDGTVSTLHQIRWIRHHWRTCRPENPQGFCRIGKKQKKEESIKKPKSSSAQPEVLVSKHQMKAQSTPEMKGEDLPLIPMEEDLQPISWEEELPPISREEELPPNPSRPAFERIPVELWEQITADFGLADIVSLSLSYHHALAMFGSRSMVQLRNPKHRLERLELLFTMSVSFPTHYLCNQCVVYHSNRKNYQDYSPPVLQIQGETWHLSYTRVAGAMASFRSRPHIPIKNTFASYFQTLHTDWQGWRTTVIEAGVVGGHLLLLVTYRRLITAALQQMFREVSEDRSPLSMPTCQHLENPEPPALQVQTAITKTPLPWQPKKSSKFKSPAFRCPYCPSEYRILTQKHEDEQFVAKEGCRFELVFYRCIDVGKAASPHCPQWRALTSKRPPGTDAALPFNVEGRGSISSRCAALLNRFELAARSVLPLLDE